MTFVILLLVMATLFSTVHAQEVTSDAAPSAETTTETSSLAETSETSEDAANEKIDSAPKESVNEKESEKQNESETTPVVISTAEIKPINETSTVDKTTESRRKHRTPKSDSVGMSDPCAMPGGCTPVPTLPAAPAPCTVSDTIGCPIDPCLAADSVLCQPQPESPVQPEEESSPQNEGTPLFSFNPLWVVGPVKPSNPSAGTLVTNPIPIELTETGPNPLIIGQADGRSVPEEVFAPAPAATTASLTGLFTGANLPWLGLLVLLVFGIFAWRGRKQ